MILRAIIVDDEFPAREELKYFLGQTGLVDVVGECEDGDEVPAALRNLRPDVVFLDIMMRSKDGLATAAALLEEDHCPYIVFTTGFSEYAAKAFELNAVDYILKPYAKERVRTCVEKVAKMKKQRDSEADSAKPLEQQRRNPPTICVWSKDRMVILQPADILFAKADEDRQTALHTTRGVFFTKTTLKELAENLKELRFLRTHKSYLVNLAKVQEVIPWFNGTYLLVLKNCGETNIPVARHYVKEFNSELGIG
ncbi:MAG: LytTR family DNA-binding domain-containing protein [Negativicutes bacterium]|nr:LytTR family DNA-binding domain-containing protein [Negativicutes bacterium]